METRKEQHRDLEDVYVTDLKEFCSLMFLLDGESHPLEYRGILLTNMV